jgi:hypothetical protein
MRLIGNKPLTNAEKTHRSYLKHRKQRLDKSKSYHELHRTEQNLKDRERKQRLKVEVLTHYAVNGVLECECCHEKHLAFLSLDHIGGGGNAHKKRLGIGGSEFYKWIKKQGYPAGYRVLCMNCNWGEYKCRKQGGCPHKRMKNHAVC